ncbi:MAG: uncharacterized protein C75L2_00690032 [Leptospirillum sp. Group II 'C75']|jgi:probable rRNA maturation factor|uniref:Endoribonuclease YbeY n=2 Tax=Leptospirillum ferriphilum TaxID=178606 RepID=A0A059XU34_9BACT|nr:MULTISPECIES: rRNA maturation RNase YbeY [Leptospirillum]EAY57223.1 MAG: conserved protein of unknown function [Leptospirillum rubarum]EIJ76854.1 MAG: uncharacterized protein C75L2_00690032 [Leptospirillum sp. Group II 'C75']MCL4405648.1 rRNA maturation RNase YbeY [Bacillota bacterium]MCL5259762.1 rRNA maturation RNase YbeY [Nitrospirota bacterium]AFS53274.1 putative metal-dependent hydrolase [Leptospirillum ferriphilum ML-04]
MPVEIDNRQKKFPVDTLALSLLANEAQKTLGEAQKNVTITFVNNRRIRIVNREYRGKNRSTDVLSFSYPSPPFPDIPFPDGEILISTEKAERQAREQNIPLETEIVNLIIHGLCHLAGHDHETGPEDALRMKHAERKIAKTLQKVIVKRNLFSIGPQNAPSQIFGKIPD